VEKLFIFSQNMRWYMNKVLEVIETRVSTREYSGKPVSDEHMQFILKAGLQAPSAVDSQPWRFVAITNKALIDDMSATSLEVLKNNEDQSSYERIKSRGGIVFYNAPAMILVLKESNAKAGSGLYAGPDLDCGIAVQNMALAATSLGLDNVIVAMAGLVFSEQCPKAEEFKKAVGIEEGYEFSIGLLLGEGTKTKEPHAINWDKVSYVK
jgi:nitroreductase